MSKTSETILSKYGPDFYKNIRKKRKVNKGGAFRDSDIASVAGRISALKRTGSMSEQELKEWGQKLKASKKHKSDV